MGVEVTNIVKMSIEGDSNMKITHYLYNTFLIKSGDKKLGQ